MDVGSERPIQGSNTYRLERDFGWTGLAIDAEPSFADAYARTRPHTRFVAAFVGDRDEGATILYRGASGASSNDRDYTAAFGDVSGEVVVPNRTLDALLAEYCITKIDFLSMDIEMSEPAALRGFSIARYRPRLVCIEAHRPTRQFILDYFARNEYVLVGDYLRADRLNLWFTPLGEHDDEQPAEGE